MQFDIVTIFPAMIEHALKVGVVGRAIDEGVLQVRVHDLRSFTSDRHHVVDDVPYGGGPGMLLKPEPLLKAVEDIELQSGARPTVILTSPQGGRFDQEVARRLSRLSHLVVLCGRYEGVDERVRSRVDEEISIGDYVVSGGELPALVIVDAVARLVPGVVGDQQSVAEESFSRGLLDFPQYTRPAAIADASGELVVPDVLLSGNHREIRRWRKRAALLRTLDRRPDLLETAALDDEEQEILRGLLAERGDD